MPDRAVLSDGFVSLRPLRASDAHPLHAAVRESLRELHLWMSWADETYDLDVAREWVAASAARWQDRSYFGFAICDAQDETFLGGCSLSHINPVYRFCNLGYWVRTSRHGEGIAGRAALLAARFAFARLGLVRVEIVIAVGNRASTRVAEKIGARYEGTLRNRMMVREQIYDARMYSLVPSDPGLT